MRKTFPPRLENAFTNISLSLKRNFQQGAIFVDMGLKFLFLTEISLTVN